MWKILTTTTLDLYKTNKFVTRITISNVVDPMFIHVTFAWKDIR